MGGPHENGEGAFSLVRRSTELWNHEMKNRSRVTGTGRAGLSSASGQFPPPSRDSRCAGGMKAAVPVVPAGCPTITDEGGADESRWGKL